MEKLFGEVNNLNMFIHPKFNEKFKFMNEKQSIELAKKVLSEFIKTKIKNIVVIESGTSPLIDIIKKLKEYENTSINIYQIKIPRNLRFNLYEWFKTYLEKQELEETITYNEKQVTRKEILKILCKKVNLEKNAGKEKFTIYDSIKNEKQYSDNQEIKEIIEGTKLYEIFNSQFLLFDEYINAGTIIRNFNIICTLFTNKPNFKISAYCMFLDSPENYKKIAFTLYNNNTELQAYKSGAYPFENRIDLIGYYYFITEKHFEKIYLEDLEREVKALDTNTDITKFYNSLNNLIIKNELLKKLKDNLQEKQVDKYVTNNDIIRFIFKYIDEKIYGKNKYSDFLDQVFELYAPAWSPMPISFHIDYWNGFEKINQEVHKIALEIEQEYKQNRFAIIELALKELNSHREKWKEKINRKMEENNENNRYINGIK